MKIVLVCVLPERRGVGLSKDIAVLMGNINMENQKQIVDGMIDAVKATGDNIYIFTNNAGRSDTKESIQGAFQIMELPDFQYFDGVVLAVDTILYPPIKSYVIDKIRKSKKPVITLDQHLEGYGCLQVSSCETQYKVVEHFIKEHGCKNIAYVRGPVGYPEADYRFEGYCKALKDNGIPFREEYVFEGDFSLESGLVAAMKMDEGGIAIDAILCASDNMAVGVMEYLKRKGTEIPRDMLIGGFDNSETAKYNNPPITSIDKNPYQLGNKAIYEILEVINGKKPELKKVTAEPHLRASCGCSKHDDIDVERLKYKYIQKDVFSAHMSGMINSSLAEFSGLQKPEDVLPVLKKSIYRTSLNAFYLCLCERDKVYILPETNMDGNFDLLQVNTEYTERIELPLAYEKGKISSYKPFEKGIVLPKEIREQAGGGNYYIVTPIYFQNCCYGYCVSGNDKLAIKSDLYYSWLTNIAVAYENIRKWMLLQDAVIRLNNVWSFDMLTQLYNRAGFFYQAKTILEILKLENSKVFLIFSDVDELKKVNDSLGHEAGDALIKEMAACIKENINDDMLAMRYGGDEFVVFGTYEKEEEVDYLIHGIQSSMELRNKSGKNEFTLSASIGVSKYLANEIKELSELIDVADMKMYEQKKKKREERKKLEENTNL